MQNKNNKKPFLSSLTTKIIIILALVIFVGSIIIISGVYSVTDHYKSEVNLKYQCETNDDCMLVFTNEGCCVFDAVNKKYQDEIEISKKANVNSFCWMVCQSKAICRNNTCTEVDPAKGDLSH